jgi:Na+/proline symporter
MDALPAGPYLVAALGVSVALATYFAGAIWSRLAANRHPSPLEFNLGLPLYRDVNELFAISLVAAATSGSTVIAFFLTGTAVYGPVLFLCALFFVCGLYLLLRAFEAAAIPDPDDDLNVGFGLLPFLTYRFTRSATLAAVVAGLSTVTLVAVLTLELSVGMDLMKHLVAHAFGTTVREPYGFLTVCLFVALLLGYVFVGGFKAVIASDVWQMKTIQWAVIALVIGAVWYISGSHGPQTAAPFTLAAPGLTRAFFLNIVLGNLFVPLALQSSWQRFEAFSRDRAFSAPRAMALASAKLAGVWTALVAVGFCLQRFPRPNEPFSRLSALGWSLDRLVLTGNTWISFFVFPLIMVAAFSAIFSTSDTCVSSILYLVEYRRVIRGTLPTRLARRHYVAMAVIFLFALLVYQAVDSDHFVAFIFVAYSSLIVLAPTVIAVALSARRGRADVGRRARLIGTSLVAGAVCYWVPALAALAVKSEWLSQFSLVFGLIASAAPVLFLAEPVRHRQHVRV